MFPKVIILQAVYYKSRFSLSYRDIEELLKIRGITVDHATIQRCVFKFTHMIDRNFRKHKRPNGLRWHLDETYIKVNGKWCYLSWVVDKEASGVYNRRNFTKITCRQSKYLNNIIEQDHRFINWSISNGLGFKSFKSASVTLSGIETVQMIKKNQVKDPGRTPFNSF